MSDRASNLRAEILFVTALPDRPGMALPEARSTDGVGSHPDYAWSATGEQMTEDSVTADELRGL